MRRARKISVSTADCESFKLVGDLVVREALPLAQENRAALALGHVLERLREAHEVFGRLARRRGQHVLHGGEVARRLDAAAAARRAASGQADVVRDLVEPRELEPQA